MRSPWRTTCALLLGLVAVPVGADGLIAARIFLPGPVEIRPGGSEPCHIEVRVRPGFHVQANPVLDPNLIPITLTLQAQRGVQAGAAIYPRARHFRLTGASDDLVVYDGRFFIEARIHVAEDAAPSLVHLRGSLRYQACDDRICLPPRTVPVLVPVRIVERGVTAR
jgi:thiol:disulfide interchange protein DsbD